MLANMKSFCVNAWNKVTGLFTPSTPASAAVIDGNTDRPVSTPVDPQVVGTLIGVSIRILLCMLVMFIGSAMIKSGMLILVILGWLWMLSATCEMAFSVFILIFTLMGGEVYSL